MIQKLLPILFIVVAVGIFFGYTNPTYSGPVAEARKEVESLNSALEAADAFKDEETELQRERAMLPPIELAKLEALLPDNVNNIQLILDLDALAARSGMRLSNFTVGQEATGDTAGDGGDLALGSTEELGSIDIMVSAQGTYTSFLSFIAATEKSLRVLDLVKLTVKAQDNGVYTYDMTFRIYWLQ